MDSIGKYLKERRESLNLSIEEVSDDTKLKTYNIKQIENDDYAAIKDVGFIKIMVITYCRALEGDEDMVLKRLNQIFDQPIEPPIKITTVKNKKPVILPLNLFWFICIGIVCIGLFYGFYTLYQNDSFSLNAIRDQLAATKKRTTSSSQTAIVAPDSVFLQQRRIFNQVMNNDVDHNVFREQNYDVEPQSDVTQDRRFLLDRTDYVGQLLFNNQISPLNPDVDS
jgi:transcriptional regulator with XRE-family HTH domain